MNAELDSATFDRLREIILFETGISLADTKLTLVSSRLRPRLMATHTPSFADYANRLSAGWHDEMVHLATAITTNVTSFFREAAHFDAVATAYRRWVSEGRRQIRIWCAGCSSGEEAYTLAMTLAEALEPSETPPGLDLRILATDLSTRALEAAMAGNYTEESVKPVSADLRNKYMAPAGDLPGTQFTMGQNLRDLILFRRLNLTHLPFALKGSLDLIMCRNVMIYFDHTFRARLLTEFERLLRPGGYLIVSHSETLVGVDAEFTTVQPAVYERTSVAVRSAV